MSAGAAIFVLSGCTLPANEPYAMQGALSPDVGSVASFSAVGTPAMVVLPNDTALAGENYIRTLPQGSFVPSTSLDGVLRLAGPLPPPFEFIIGRDLVPAVDGPYSYAARNPAPGVTCVLAIGGATAAYATPAAILMRNCVRGDLTRALAPMNAHSL